jgi:DNA-binding NtrC family response regulator
MFDLRRVVHMGRSTRRAIPKEVSRTSSNEPVQLVAIIQDPDDSKSLEQIAASYGWKISIVGSSDAAVAFLKEQPTPLVICDRDLSSEAWSDVLGKIAAQPQAVCVLLASRVADQYLWNQVIQHHGYDLVVKPFQPEELRRAVTFAWSWRGWTSRHYTQAQRKSTS